MNNSLRDEVEALAMQWRETARQMEQSGINSSIHAATNLLASAHELESAISRHPPADGVVVPRELLRHLRDYSEELAGSESVRWERERKIREDVAQASAILSEGKA